MHDDLDLRLPPALETFGDALLATMQDATEPMLAVNPRDRRGWWRFRRPSRIGAAAVLVALCGGSAALADVTGAFNSAQPTSPNGDQVAALAPGPDQIDYAMLSILRRPQQPGDALPTEPNRDQDPIARSTGENPALARKVSFGSLGDAWVIPADGGVCLQSDGGGCDNDYDGHPPYIQLLGGGIDHPGVYHITGLVPDGVNTVQLHLADGTTDTVTVNENVYMANITVGITSTTFSLPDGTAVTLGENGPPTNGHMKASPCAPAVDTNCPSRNT
jgi:hypothetical protein